MLDVNNLTLSLANILTLAKLPKDVLTQNKNIFMI